MALFYLPRNLRTSALRDDIRRDINKKMYGAPGGGDFHGPFWADAKTHVTGHADLRLLTDDRVASNKRRQRLYPLLRSGFLTWWNEKRRWINEPFEIVEGSIKKQFVVEALGCTVKVENLLSVKIGDESHRLVYPYFSEKPALTAESARVGLWVLNQALPVFSVEDFRILDVLRSASFATIDSPLQGNEEGLFMSQYTALLAEWRKLRKEYE